MFIESRVSEYRTSEKLSGLVERVTFHSPENGFCVLKVRVPRKNDLVVVVGNSPTISAGEHIECTGQWIVDKEYGRQFKTEMLKSTPPTSIEGIEKYLASGLIKGVGPVYAKKLVEGFGEDIFTIIDEDHLKLKTIPGIGDAKIKLIKSSWDAQKVVRKIIVFLHSHSIGTARATRIYKEYGENAIAIVEENPYRLANDIRGIGFKSADKIAESLGVEKHSMIRVRAGVNYALTKAMDDGNCGLPILQLISSTQKLLEILEHHDSESLVQEALKLEINAKNVVVEVIDDQECIFLKGLAVQETQIAQTLVNMSRGKKTWQRDDNDKAIAKVTKEIGIQLSSNQLEALKWTLCSRFSVITGGPGVGKTTVINTIVKVLEQYKVKVLLSAPTGRAAKRLSEATGHTATTIHRLLKRNPDQEFHKTNNVECDLLIIDEVSMLDVPLMHAVLKALPQSGSLLLVGDIDQLPSVGPGQVLSDIINSHGVTVTALTKVFRQDDTSSIITNAYRVNQGLMPILSGSKDFYFIECDTPELALENVTSLVKTRLPEKFGTSPFTDIQVLSPMTRGDIGTRNLNIELQKALNPFTSEDSEVSAFGYSFRVNDKVMQTVNNYDKDVFNGDIGFISRINKNDAEVAIIFDSREVIYDYSELDEVVHAYATTIHKSQGSEYNTIIIPLMMQHYMMLQRNLIYTAITRAKKLVVIVGQQKALRIAVNKASASNRYSTLKKRLIELVGWC